MLTGNINCQWGNTGSKNWEVINKFQMDIEATKAISKEKKTDPVNYHLHLLKVIQKLDILWYILYHFKIKQSNLTFSNQEGNTFDILLKVLLCYVGIKAYVP